MSKPARDRYLSRQYNRFFFRMAVPKRLQDAVGCTTIVRKLETGDIKTARRRRDALLAEVKAWFASITPEQSPEPWSPSEILSTARALRVSPPVEGAHDAWQTFVWEAALAQPIPGRIDGPAGAAVEQGERIVSGEAGGLRLSAAVEEHLEHIARRVVPSTVAARRRHLGELVRHLGDLPVSTITRRHLAQWVTDGLLANAELSPKSRSNRAGDVVAFGAWLQDAGLWDDNRAAGLRKLLRGSTRGQQAEGPRPWTDAELSALRGRMAAELAPDDPLRVLVPVLMHTGLRREEACALTGADIEEVEGVLCFRVRQGKTASSIRDVPVHPELLSLVEGLKADQYLVPGLSEGGQDNKRGHAIGSRFARLKKAWGFPAEVDMHGFRRTFARKLKDARVPMHTAELILGHRTRSLTYGLYGRGEDIPALAAAVQAVSYPI
jgi:integrase